MYMHTCGILGAFEHDSDFTARESLLRLQQHRGTLLWRQSVECGTKPADRLIEHCIAFGTGFSRRRIESELVGFVVRTCERHDSPPPSISPLMVNAQVDQDSIEP